MPNRNSDNKSPKIEQLSLFPNTIKTLKNSDTKNKEIKKNKESFNIDKSFRFRFWQHLLTSNENYVINHLRTETKTNINKEFINSFIDILKLSKDTKGKLKGKYIKYYNEEKYKSSINSSLFLLNYYIKNGYISKETVSKWYKLYSANDVKKIIMFIAGNYNKILSKTELIQIKYQRDFIENIRKTNSEVRNFIKENVQQIKTDTLNNGELFNDYEYVNRLKNDLNIQNKTLKIVNNHINDYYTSTRIKEIIQSKIFNNECDDLKQILNDLDSEIDKFKNTFVPKTPNSLKATYSKITNAQKIIAFDNDYNKNTKKSKKAYMVDPSIRESNDCFTVKTFNVSSNFKVFDYDFTRPKDSNNYEPVSKRCIIYVNEYYLNKHPNHKQEQQKLENAINYYTKEGRTVHLCINGDLPTDFNKNLFYKILRVPNKQAKEIKDNTNTMINNISTHFEQTRKSLKQKSKKD